jgi:hypothetical protein
MPVTGVVTSPARLVRSYGGLEGRRQAEGRRGPLSPPVARLGAAEDPLRTPLRHAAICHGPRRVVRSCVERTPNGDPTQQRELPRPAFTGHNVGDHWILSVLAGRLTRQPTDIVTRLGGALAVSVVLLTGTAVALLPDFALRVGDELITAATSLGELRNVAEVAGLQWPEGGG